MARVREEEVSMSGYKRATAFLMAALFISTVSCGTDKIDEAATQEEAESATSEDSTASENVFSTSVEGSEDVGGSEDAEDSQDTAGSEDLNELEENPREVSYMEKMSDRIVEMPPEEVKKAQEGITYSEFQKYVYYSTTAERDTSVNVLLPPDYSEEKEYPVVYILHGYYDSEDWMARPVVCVSEMLSNLYADGEAEEMIVVLPYIYCSRDMPYCTGMDLQNSLNYDNFVNDLVTDLMPFIENTFSVATGRENTAITGFSMGGRESLFIGFSHPELFGYIGAVCPAPGLTLVNNSPMHPGQMEEAELSFTDNPPYVLLISAAVNDGVVSSSPYSYHNMLDTNGTEHLWHTMAKTGHDHSSVTPHLYNFFRIIFREK